MQHTRYMPGLDGLRAMVVAVVMIYHLNYSWAPGGVLGVGIFFVLSGLDILPQWKQLQKLDFKDFWIRRVKRLLPALFTMLISTVVSNTKEAIHSESTKKHQSNLESTRKAKTEPKSTTPTQPKTTQPPPNIIV